MSENNKGLSRELRVFLGIQDGEPADRAIEFMERWQMMRIKKSWGELKLKIQNGKEVHGEQNNSF
jgi:hypothetical protein